MNLFKAPNRNFYIRAEKRLCIDMLIVLFIILGLLYGVESSTAISRKAGYAISNPASGLIFQSSLSLLSRALLFLFMPILGYLSDSNKLLNNHIIIFFLFTIIPFVLFMVFFQKELIEKLIGRLLLRINKNGSYFIRSNQKYSFKKLNTRHKLTMLRTFYIVVCIVYLPYYLSWPIIMYLLDRYNENRGFILGLSSVFNGINTIAITIWIDPLLAKFGRYKNLIQKIYPDLIRVRLISSIIAWLLLTFLFFL